MRSDKSGGAGNDNTQAASRTYSKRRLPHLGVLQSRLSDMSDASWAERAMLLAVLAVSGAWFWLRFRRVLEIIQRSRKTTDFDLAPWGPRIRQFLSEVVFQTKVIRQRPLPGL